MRISDWSSDVCSSDLFASIAASGRSVLLLRNPPVHAPLQQVQRQRAAAEYRVVEAADIEAVAQFGLRLPAQLLDPDHADLVGRGLARIDQVPLAPALRRPARDRKSHEKRKRVFIS